MQSVAGSRYAQALAEVILAPGSGIDPATATAQLKSFEQLLAASGELNHVMLSPAVASSKKRAVIARLAPELGLHNKIRNFLYVVVDHRRVHQLGEIRQAFEDAVDARLGFVRAQISSAGQLDDSRRRNLETQFERITGKRVRAAYAIDESLIGGVVARIGSTVYDGSVKGQLEVLRRKLVTEA